jgi:hypothetical protein
MIKDLFLKNAVKFLTVLDKIKKDKRGVNAGDLALTLLIISTISAFVLGLSILFSVKCPR